MPLDRLADQLVRADEYINLAGSQLLEYILDLLGRLGSTQVLDFDGEVLEPLLECSIVLQRQNGCRHEHGNLLAVGGNLECGTHGNLRLAEAYITADEPVHRRAALQIVLDIESGLCLIGCVLVDERCLQFLLHISVGRVGDTGLLLARCIQANKVAGDLLHFVLGALLEPLPSARTDA